MKHISADSLTLLTIIHYPKVAFMYLVSAFCVLICIGANSDGLEVDCNFCYNCYSAVNQNCESRGRVITGCC